MTTPALFQAMARYNAWMNEKLYAAASTLSDEERKADRGAFFGSIHGTLDHLVFGDRAWMNRLGPRDYPLKPLGGLQCEDWDELRAARVDLDADIVGWAGGLTEDWLAETLEWKSGVYARDFSHPHWGLVMQLFNHQTHHRGQATTLLTQAGVDVGPTDLPVAPIWG
ncbi:MAG: DinB family protein [Maricaulaceae bacterium]